MWKARSQSSVGYVLAVVATVLAVVARWALDPILGATASYHPFYISVILLATVWGRGPGLFAVFLGALAGTWLFVLQYGLPSPLADDILRLFVYVGVGVAVSLLAGRLHDQNRRVNQQRDLLAVTLASIHDGVIVTDRLGRVTYLNGNAERLTGWAHEEARDQPLGSVFRAISEQTRQPVRDPAESILQLGMPAELTDQTVLLAKDGRQIPIEGSGAAIRGADGAAQGVVLVFRDSFEQRKTQATLKEAADLRQMALDAAELGAWEYDFERRQVFGDERAFTIVQVAQQHIPWQQFLELIHPEDRQRVDEVAHAATHPDSPGRYVVEYRIIYPDGTVRWIAARGQVFFRGDRAERRASRFVGTVADITARKEATEALERRNQGLRLLSQAAADLLAASDPDRMVQDLFTRVAAFLQADMFFDYMLDDNDVQQPLHLNVAGGIDAETRAEVDRLAIGQALCGISAQTGRPLHVPDVQHSDLPEAARARQLGLRAYVCHPLLAGNRLVGTLSFASRRKDRFTEHELEFIETISHYVAMAKERLRMERDTRASEERFRAFFDNVAVGTAILNLQGRFLEVNDCYCQITSYPREELLGLTPPDLSHPDDRARDRDNLMRFLQGDAPTYEVEKRYVRKDGSMIWVQVTGSLIRDAEGRALRMVGVIQDITARKEAEVALAAARKSAEEARTAAENANQAKSQFLAHMSHELRTPMNSILGMTELALQEPLSPAVRDCLQTAKESADTLLVLIDEVLDLSRIESGALLLESKPFGVRSLLDDTLRAIAVRSFEKDLELVCHVAPAVPDRLVGDPLRLRQILTNLLGNAIKFTERGEIVVQVDLEREDSSEARLRFAVADTGIGIATENQQLVFVPFTQADPSMPRRYGGSGLGLSIVSRLVGMLGGEVGLESQLGRGSTFHFTVPLRRETGQELPDSQQLFLTQLKDQPILVADRLAVNRRILAQILSGWAMRPVLAQDGPSALAQLRAAAGAGQRIPLVILDASMPGTEELHLVEQIQTDEQIRAVVVLTVTPAQRQQLVRRPGFENRVIYLEKPISPLAVSSALAGAMGVGVHEATQLVPFKPTAPERILRILLAEDTPGSQKLAVRLLNRRGHVVELAQNGREAVERLSGAPFDVVLMDVQMPVMDGFQATDAIRRMASPDKARIPIIAMTAHALKGDQDQCLAAGMDAYISKPINGQELIALVERAAADATRRRTRHNQTRPPDADLAQQRPETPFAEQSPEPQTTGAGEADVFDLNEALRKCYGSYHMLQEMVDCFFNEADQLTEQMRSAAAQGDPEEAYHAAHRLKNTVVYLGAAPAIEATRHVERFSKACDLAAATGAIEELERHLSRLKPALAPHRQNAQSS